MSLSKNQAAVVEQILRGDWISGECELFSLQDQNGRKRYQGVARATDGMVSVVFSLPDRDNARVFLVLTEDSIELARRVVATLDEWDNAEEVHLGNCQLIDDPIIRAKGYCGAIILPAETSNLLEHLPLTVNISGADYTPGLVVMLTPEEYALRKQRGHDALMEFWESSGKEIVF